VERDSALRSRTVGLSLPCGWPVETYKLSNLGNQVTFLNPPWWESQNSPDDPIFM